MVKEQISNHHELISTPSVWEQLWTDNAVLSPEVLRNAFPFYSKFNPFPENPLIWSRSGENPSSRPIIVGLYGPTAAGKDMLIGNIAIPHETIKTVTSRPENPERLFEYRYYFVSKEEFIERQEKGEFLESMEESGGLYGTTKSEVVQKIQQAKEADIPFILWRGNVQGHRTFAPRVFEEFHISVPGIFILPCMPIQAYSEHIQKERGIEEAQQRWGTWQAEIEHAPGIVDYLLMNQITKKNGKQEAIDSCNYLLSRLCSSS